MAKEDKRTKIRAAFEEFANLHKGETLTTKEINEGVKLLLGDTLSGLCVSDFAIPETERKESKYNKTLFYRLERGSYRVIGTDTNG